MTPRIDRVVTVDWSAASTPKVGADSIWICTHLPAEARTEVVNPSTRREAEALLTRLCGAPGRTLIAVDVALAYPAGSAAAAGLTGESGRPAWEALCAHLHDALLDDDRNRNNRWEVAAELNRRIGSAQFWGAPVSRTTPWLPARRPASPPLAWFRRSEDELLRRGLRPSSPWQLLGVGSVGSQSLTFAPVTHRLRAAHPGRVAVWPIETGAISDPWRGRRHGTVLAESWTSLPPAEAVRAVDQPIRDARQVVALAHWLADQAHTGSPLFRPPSAMAHRDVLDEEGWVLGLL